MTDYFVLFGDFLVALPTYTLNGFFATMYWLSDHGAGLMSMLCAGIMVYFVDQRVQSQATFRPGRNQREAQMQPQYTAQITTILTISLWIVSQWGMAAPVPWLGASMWIVGTIIVFLVQTQEAALLWQVKSGIAIYGLAVLGSRIYLTYTATLSAAQWATWIGSSESASLVIANTRGNVTTIILWALWLVVPLGYFAMLLQQVLIHPMSFVNPLASANELIRRYRMRE
jgi:hypothetical protein